MIRGPNILRTLKLRCDDDYVAFLCSPSEPNGQLIQFCLFLSSDPLPDGRLVLPFHQITNIYPQQALNFSRRQALGEIKQQDLQL